MEIRGDIERNLKKLDDICRQVESGLSRKYEAEALSCYDHEVPHEVGQPGVVRCSRLLEFLYFLLTGSRQRVRVPRIPLNEYLGDAWLFMGAETLEIRSPTDSRYAQMIDFKDYMAFTEPGMLNELLVQNYEFVLTQSFSFLDKHEGLRFLEVQQNLMRNSGDGSVSQVEELSEAIDDLVAGQFSMGEYHFSLMVFGETAQEARDKTVSALTVLRETGFIATLISVALDSAFFAQLPGNWKYRPRVATLTSHNFSGLSCLHNFSSGKRDGNPWGQAVTLLKTDSRQPFYFNFHTVKKDEAEDVTDQKIAGNTRIIGQTGTGKTVLMGFLYAQLQKFAANSRNGFSTVFFDKDRGAELLIRATGGRYLSVETGKPTGFNPFQLEPTERNMDFCASLVKWICRLNSQKITTIEEQNIDRAIRTVFRLPKAVRGLLTVTQNLTEGITREERENSVVRRLSRWCRGGALGWVMDCEADVMDFNACRNFGIDGTEFLDNPEVCAPISMYLLHRMEEVIDGRRFAYFMDEFWKWLLDDAFSDFAFNKQKTIRKQNGFGVFATQSPADVLRSPISRTLIEQCVTEIYLPNPRGNFRDYVEGQGGENGDFGLTETEFELLKSFDEDSRRFLVKQGRRSAVARLDLSGFDDALAILSGSTDSIVLAHEVMSEVGEAPEDWLPVFHRRRKERVARVYG